jgi:hypothetical protein
MLIQLTPHWGSSVTDYIKYYAYLYYLLLDYLFLQQLWCYFPNYVYPNPPYQLFLWEETGAPGENHDFRQSVDRLFSHESTHESVARLEPTSQRWSGASSDDCTTEAHSGGHLIIYSNPSVATGIKIQLCEVVRLVMSSVYQVYVLFSSEEVKETTQSESGNMSTRGFH